MTSEPPNATATPSAPGDTAPIGAWSFAGAVLALDRPHLLTVVNATPDSFSDGGRCSSPDVLVEHAVRAVEAGASVIDVGGESTRPGACRVSVAEQIDRTAPVIEAIRRRHDVPVSIDTTRSGVASAAVEAGATIINDVSAGLEDEKMLALAAAHGCGVILMHRRLPPGEDRYSHEYEREPAFDDVVSEVGAFLAWRAAAAEAAGVPRASIVIDPGLGFGKSVGQNYELIRRTGELRTIGYPLLSAASRKSFLGAVSGVASPADRVGVSTAVTVAHFLAGVRLFRVHDTAAHREALAVAAAIAGTAGPPLDEAARTARILPS